jgi:four helix bundle protein
MTIMFNSSLLPHHRLRAYGVALQLLDAVREAQITDRTLRDHALRAAKAACLNCAEGAARVTRADKARSYTVARGEGIEAVAAVEIASSTNEARAAAVPRVVALGTELYAMLTKLVR